MKRIFAAIVFFAPIIFSACKPAGAPGSFTVSGKLENMPRQKIYLQMLPYNGTAPSIVDSAVTTADGIFSLKTTAKEQDIFFIGQPGGPQWFVINDNSDVKINADANSVRHPQIENSDATKALYSFIEGYIEKDSAVEVLYNQADSVQKSSGDINTFSSLQAQGQQKLVILNDYIKNFINTSSNPACIHFALMQVYRTHSMSDSSILALAGAACTRFPEHSGLSVLKSTLATNLASSNPPYPLLDQQAPDLTFNDVNGKPVSISSFKGKYLLVDFWASWCGPCRQENPNVVAAYNKFKDKNFAILGVSLDNDKSAWIDAIKHDGLVWTQMSDLKQWDSQAVGAYQFNGIPFNVLVDPTGKIIASSLRGADLENKLAEVLK